MLTVLKPPLERGVVGEPFDFALALALFDHQHKLPSYAVVGCFNTRHQPVSLEKPHHMEGYRPGAAFLCQQLRRLTGSADRLRRRVTRTLASLKFEARSGHECPTCPSRIARIHHRGSERVWGSLTRRLRYRWQLTDHQRVS